MIPRFLISLKTFFYKNFQSAVFKPLANDKTGLITCQNISLGFHIIWLWLQQIDKENVQKEAG